LWIVVTVDACRYPPNAAGFHFTVSARKRTVMKLIETRALLEYKGSEIFSTVFNFNVKRVSISRVLNALKTKLDQESGFNKSE
jgi:hypothetical protein